LLTENIEEIISADAMGRISNVAFEEADDELKTCWMVYVRKLLPCCLTRPYKKILQDRSVLEASTVSDEAFLIWVLEVYLDRWKKSCNFVASKDTDEVEISELPTTLAETLFGVNKKRKREQVVNVDKARFNEICQIVMGRRLKKEINDTWENGYRRTKALQTAKVNEQRDDTAHCEIFFFDDIDLTNALPV
jgi:hypothetical protein